jgi:5-methylcytosine-specific restriction endonuclease McrA
MEDLERRERAREAQKKYRETHKEKLREKHNASSRADYQKHKDRYKANAKKWAENNSERRKEIVTKWGLNNPERKREFSNAYYENNKERVAVVHREYLKNNPDVRKERNKRRRARERGASVELFKSIEIYKRDGWICQLCKKKVNKRFTYPNPWSASIDHIIPLSKGGGHSRDNVQMAHLICNKKAFTGGVKQLLLLG